MNYQDEYMNDYVNEYVNEYDDNILAQPNIVGPYNTELSHPYDYIRDNDYDAVQDYLEHEWDQERYPNRAYYMLIDAIQNGNLDLIKLLLKYTNPNQPNEENVYALFQAHKSFKMMKVLLDAGADPNIYDEHGTYLVNAVVGDERNPDRYDILQLLIDKGADLNDGDWYQGTPLILAVKNGDIDMVNFLLENGSEPAINFEGTSALDIAVEAKYDDIANLIREYQYATTKRALRR